MKEEDIMQAKLIWLITGILLSIGSHSAFAAEELYLVDLRKTPGILIQGEGCTSAPLAVKKE
jgi:hypothetical protein